MLLFLAMQAAVPPPLAQRAADCIRPIYATDQLVCEDADLLALDTAMVRLLDEHGAPSASSIEPQEDWFRRSRLCAMREEHRACVAAAYGERLALLNASATVQPAKRKCKGDATSMAEMPAGAALYVADGSFAGWGQTDSNLWSPFLTISRKGRATIFKTQDGRIMVKCG